MKCLSFDKGILYYYLVFEGRKTNDAIVLTLKFIKKELVDGYSNWVFRVIDICDDKEDRLISFTESSVASILTFRELSFEINQIIKAESKGVVY